MNKTILVVGSESEAHLLATKLDCYGISISIAINIESDALTEKQKKFSNIDFLVAPIHQKPIRIFKDKQRYQKHFKKNKLK